VFFNYLDVVNMKNKSVPVKSDVDQIDIKGPMVISPSYKSQWRPGKGYSYKEIRAADIPIDDLRKIRIPIDKRRNSIHQRNVEELGRLYRQMISDGALTLEEEIKPTHKSEAIKHLKKVPEISRYDAQILTDAGIFTISHLAEEDPKSLAKDLDIELAIVKKWIESAKNIKSHIDAKLAFKKLSKISGIKKKYVKDLVDLGIHNIDDLLNANPEKIAEKLDIDIDEILFWLDQVRDLKGITEHVEVQPILPKKKKIETEEIIEELEEPLEADQIIEDELTEPETPIIDVDIISKAETELLKCKGIGKKSAEKLIDAGIFSLKELVDADPNELEKLSGISKSRISQFQKSAKDLI